MLGNHFTRTRLGIVLAVVVGVVLGAVFGQPGSGQAASSAVPTNKTPPTIGGAGEAGLPLTATRGTWTGTPTSFRFAWLRCDASGNGCVTIAGATSRTYNVTDADVGHTIRVKVIARNASGSSSPVISGTTVIISPGGCPPGTGVIPIASLNAPARLAITSAFVSPAVTLGSHTIRIHVGITACGGRPVQGALVFGTAVPYNQYSAPPEGTTGADGTVNLTMTQRSGFPAARQQQLLVVFIRARKPGESITGGISTRLLVSFPVSLRK
jgi:hypothetical protein